MWKSLVVVKLFLSNAGILEGYVCIHLVKEQLILLKVKILLTTTISLSHLLFPHKTYSLRIYSNPKKRKLFFFFLTAKETSLYLRFEDRNEIM